MRQGYIEMSLKEIDRLKILEAIGNKKLKQIEGARRLGVTARQMKRICKAYRKDGVASVTSKKRGKISNRRLPDTVRSKVFSLIREQYHDFGPTLAQEKLTEVHGYSIGVETVRQMMIAGSLWTPKARKRIKVHQMRTRRPCRGELIQIDGSHHDWFEGRRAWCCLLVAVDDATGEAMGLRFVETESLAGYFALLDDYLHQHGRPLALYSDKHVVFKVNAKEAVSGTGETQFGRAMRELGIELICANSPQAKGRVERLNGTLQDRLIKEMRLLKISDIETANAYLPTFAIAHKKRFAVIPASPLDQHRIAIPRQKELDLIFSIQSTRKLSKALEISYQNIIYQVQIDTPSYSMRGASIIVAERKGNITLLYKNRCLPYNTMDKKNQSKKEVTSKEIDMLLDGRRFGNKPNETHPWKRNYPVQFNEKRNTLPA